MSRPSQPSTSISMDMRSSPPGFPAPLNDTMRQPETRYALHRETAYPPWIYPRFTERTQDRRHGEVGVPTAGNFPRSAVSGVPRGLSPSPLVAATHGVRPQWPVTYQPIERPNVYRDEDPGQQYTGLDAGPSGVHGVAEEAYAYCLDRGNGEYTRLIPADMLPEMQDVPRRQHNVEGITILPVPSGRAPRGVPEITCPIRFKVSREVAPPPSPRDPALSVSIGPLLMLNLETGCCHTQDQHRPADGIQVRAPHSVSPLSP